MRSRLDYFNGRLGRGRAKGIACCQGEGGGILYLNVNTARAIGREGRHVTRCGRDEMGVRVPGLPLQCHGFPWTDKRLQTGESVNQRQWIDMDRRMRRDTAAVVGGGQGIGGGFCG